MTEDPKAQVKWYLKPVAVIVAILVAGPFAIPLIWLSPAFNKWWKIILTVAVIAVTVWTINLAAGIFQQMLKDLQQLQDVMK